MKRNWLLDELTEHFTFLPNEMQREKQDWALRSSSNFSIRSAFPFHKFEVPKAVIQYIAKQIQVQPELYAQYNWAGRSITYHQTQISSTYMVLKIRGFIYFTN